MVWVGAGALVIPAGAAACLLGGGALNDLYQATIAYNLQLRRDIREPLGHGAVLAVFPIQHAQVDALWFVGGLGCLVLLVAALWRLAGPVVWLPIAWAGAACLSIAINGSRSLPQYFLQAAPALAFAAGLAAAIALPPLPKVARLVAILLVAVGVWRAGDDPFPKLARNVWHDTQYIAGRIDRRTHLSMVDP